MYGSSGGGWGGRGGYDEVTISISLDFLPAVVDCRVCSALASSLKPSRFLSFWLYSRIFLESENNREILSQKTSKEVRGGLNGLEAFSLRKGHT